VSRHPNRPCRTAVSSYGFYFQPDRAPQWQWLCEGCGDLTSGFPTEAAAAIAGHNHEGLDAVVNADAVEVDRVTRLRAEQAALVDSLPDFIR
jgi:hypothetical protein